MEMEMILSDGFWKWEIPLSHTHQHAHTKLERFRLDLQIQFSSSATQSYRSKVKAYERQKGFLGDVAIEMTCHSESRVSSMAEEVEKKVADMDNMMKVYKKLTFQAESELKKETPTNFREQLQIPHVHHQELPGEILP